MGKDILDGSLSESSISSPALMGGFFAALISGIFACIWMVKLVRKSKLRYFAIYCVLLAITVAIIYYSRI
jgi:undecaprenyl-diphosphatase